MSSKASPIGKILFANLAYIEQVGIKDFDPANTPRQSNNCNKTNSVLNNYQAPIKAQVAAEEAPTTTRCASVISKSVISTQKQKEGRKKINQYIVMKVIGQGSFGKVKLVLNTEEKNKPYAMKSLSKSKLKRIFVGKNRTAM
jgi:hypothetical protein